MVDEQKGRPENSKKNGLRGHSTYRGECGQNSARPGHTVVLLEDCIYFALLRHHIMDHLDLTGSSKSSGFLNLDIEI